MFLEIAEITVTDPEAFEIAVADAKAFFLRAKGCHGLTLHRVIETPSVYRLVVQWETVEHHTVTFRNSDEFQEWRRLASPLFAEPPKVTHSWQVI